MYIRKRRKKCDLFKETIIKVLKCLNEAELYLIIWQLISSSKTSLYFVKVHCDVQKSQLLSAILSHINTFLALQFRFPNLNIKAILPSLSSLSSIFFKSDFSNKIPVNISLLHHTWHMFSPVRPVVSVWNINPLKPTGYVMHQ